MRIVYSSALLAIRYRLTGDARLRPLHTSFAGEASLVVAQVPATARSNVITRLLRAALTATVLLLATLAAAAPDLTTIMQDPGWIGAPVESAWWQFNEDNYIYTVKRAGSGLRDQYRVSVASEHPEMLAPEALLSIDGPNPIVSRDGRHVLSIVAGSLLVRELDTGVLKRLYTGQAPVTQAQFNSDGDAVHFETQSQWWRVGLNGESAYPLTDLRFAADPLEVTEPLAEEQLRLFSTLARERDHQLAAQQSLEQREQLLPALGAAPWYFGDDMQRVDSSLSADGRWLLLSVEPSADNGDVADAMPHYVTQSGYVEIEDVRNLVGRASAKPNALWLLDLHNHNRYSLSLEALSGRDKDPLAKLKKQQGLDPYGPDNLRPVSVSGMVWHPDQGEALVQVFSNDYKDRWTVRVNTETQTSREIHRLTDNAWVNWDFNEFGWVPNTTTPWLLSEQSGYAHLYTIDPKGRAKQRTQGEFELRGVVFSPSGDTAYARSNRAHPTEWDLHSIDLASGTLRQVTALKGVEDFVLHPSADKALVMYSSAYTPMQAGVVDLVSGELRLQTDTRTAEYRALEWQAPEYVAVPSSHNTDKPIWSKFYSAAEGFAGPRPVVMFVHGAGYTQNTHHKFPYYFREQMFHNLLTSRGYHVLDMDYRASEGYGRDWRTAIYRQMGTPELEDYIDGANYLVREHNADPARIGIYGGSYGGFMTFMALFKAPEVFAAGAALRPVTDWRHYNHDYTARILNTPAVDPEAHRQSSPIEFADGLRGHLLISHGMLDDNVFFKDSVRITQRLIELEKQHWELASYPLEAHGYIHPESWLDQYRRILNLFESTIGKDP